MKNARTTFCAVIVAVATAVGNAGFNAEVTKIARVIQDAAIAVALVFARDQAQHEKDKRKAVSSVQPNG